MTAATSFQEYVHAQLNRQANANNTGHYGFVPLGNNKITISNCRYQMLKRIADELWHHSSRKFCKHTNFDATIFGSFIYIDEIQRSSLLCFFSLQRRSMGLCFSSI